MNKITTQKNIALCRNNAIFDIGLLNKEKKIVTTLQPDYSITTICDYFDIHPSSMKNHTFRLTKSLDRGR